MTVAEQTPLPTHFPSPQPLPTHRSSGLKTRQRTTPVAALTLLQHLPHTVISWQQGTHCSLASFGLYSLMQSWHCPPLTTAMYIGGTLQLSYCCGWTQLLIACSSLNALSGQDDSAVKFSLLKVSFWLSAKQAALEEQGEQGTHGTVPERQTRLLSVT